MARFLHTKEQKRRIYFETISTFEPFNAIFLELNLLLESPKTSVDFLFKYHKFFAKLLIDHDYNNNQSLLVKGKCKVESSLHFIKKSTLNYDMNWQESNDISSSIELIHNDDKIFAGKLNGTAEMETANTDFLIDIDVRNFKKENFKGNLLYNMIGHEIDAKLQLFTSRSIYNSSLTLNIENDISIAGTLNSTGALPLKSWFAFSSNATEKVIHGEIKFAGIQYFAINLEYKNDDNGLVVTTAINFFLKVYAFKIIMIPEKVSLLIEDKRGKDIFNRLYLHIKIQEPTEILPEKKSSLKLSVKTQYKVFDQIEAHIRYQGNQEKQQLEAKYEYKDYFVEGKALSKQIEAVSNLLKLSIQTNFMDSNVSSILIMETYDKHGDILLKVVQNSYNYNLNLLYNTEATKKTLSLISFGTEGNWTMDTLWDSSKELNHFEATFLDRENLQFKYSVNMLMTEHEIKLDSSITTPFTDKVTAEMNLSMLDNVGFTINIFQPSFVYAKASIFTRVSSNLIELKGRIDFKSLIFMPVAEFNIQVESI